MAKEKAKAAAVEVRFDSAVLRKIRRHTSSSMDAEVCGVLIGSERGNTVTVDACIAGESAGQGSAHVTFTQETWEHIYKIKDKEYPDDRIVGWYHSHPGFGIFLSDHDTFIHENFFSSPAQIAWVHDPNSDEEGCFGWVDGKIRRLPRIVLIDSGKADGVVGIDEPRENHEPGASPPLAAEPAKSKPWLRWLKLALIYLVVFALGALAAMFFIIPPVIVIGPDGRPLDPQIVRELIRAEQSRRQSLTQPGTRGHGRESDPAPAPAEPSGGTGR
jgi:proteasome lid subunit RPN8/RPN11